jgi:hypothetical protein
MDKKQKSFEFALVGIKTNQFAIISEKYSQDSNTSVELKFDFDVDKEKHHLALISAFNYIQNNSVVIKLEVVCLYKISDTSWSECYNEKEDKVIFPKNFITHLSALTIGTARGILHTKTEGTLYNKHLIPIIDVSNLLKEDIVLEFSDKKNQ